MNQSIPYENLNKMIMLCIVVQHCLSKEGPMFRMHVIVYLLKAVGDNDDDDNDHHRHVANIIGRPYNLHISNTLFFLRKHKYVEIV